jgi:cell division transport system ATP-binding protein
VAGHSRSEQRRLAYNALRSVGLNHRINTLPRILSGGEQQRVAVARAVVNEPELLLADEPTGNLDPDLAVDIMRLFREINARGTTVLVATHDRELIQRMQRRTVVLKDGRVVDPGTPER